MATQSQIAMEAVAKELSKVHGLTEREAASFAITISCVVHMRLLPSRGGPTKRCPFLDPKFDVGGEDKPCPVCGMLGTIDAEYLCVD